MEISDIDYQPLPANSKSPMQEQAAKLRKAVQDIHDLWETHSASDPSKPFDYTAYRAKQAELVGALMGVATCAAIYIEVYADE